MELGVGISEWDALLDVVRVEAVASGVLVKGGEGRLRGDAYFRVPDDAPGAVVVVGVREVIEPVGGVSLVKGQLDGKLPVDVAAVHKEDGHRVKAGDGGLRNVSHAVAEAAGPVVNVLWTYSRLRYSVGGGSGAPTGNRVVAKWENVGEYPGSKRR